MAWDFVSVSTYAEVGSGNLTLNAPANIQEGDLLVACIAYRSNVAFTLPANWNLVATQQSSGDTDATQGIASGVMAWIVRGASNPSFTFTRTGGDVAQGTILAYRGQASSPYDTGGAATLGAIGEPSLAGISTAEANELLVAMVSSGDNSSMVSFDAVTSPNVASGATDTSTEPTSETWIERFDRGSNTGADTGLAVADAIKPASGSTGTFSADAQTTTRSVFIVAAFKQGAQTYSMTMGGGGLGGGAATVTAQKTVSVSMSGGGISGGGVVAVFGRLYAISGGAVVAGAADIAAVHAIAVTMAGGGIAGGTATVEFETALQSYPMTMDGGGVSGGAADVTAQHSYSATMAGGGIAGGAADVALQQSLSLSMTGGSIGGGSGGVTAEAAFAMAGGGVCGGEAPADFSAIVELFLSGNIPAGGATPTTFRLTAPVGKSGSDFAAGFISDDTNPVSSLDLGSGQFTELEWSLRVSDAAVMGDEFEFRVTDNGAELTAYLQTPKASVAVVQSLEITMQGGAVAGGAGETAASIVLAASGGAIGGGAAELVFEKTLSVTMSGGAVSGGAAGEIASVVAAGAGGAVAGGAAGQSKGSILSMAGGAVVGGAALYSTSAGIVHVMDGGAVTGGAADLLRGTWHVIQGGAVAGGAAGCEGTLGRSIITRVRKSGGGVIPLREPDEDALRERIEREYEERLIMATIKMFLESQDKWAA